MGTTHLVLAQSRRIESSDDAGNIFAGVVVFVLFVIVVVGLAAQRSNNQRKAREQAEQASRERYAWLVSRFGPDAANAITAGRYWQGQTAEQLELSLGRPADVDEHVMPSKVKHVYKYRPMGFGRFGLRVTLENGVVVGWET